MMVMESSEYLLPVEIIETLLLRNRHFKERSLFAEGNHHFVLKEQLIISVSRYESISKLSLNFSEKPLEMLLKNQEGLQHRGGRILGVEEPL